MRAATALRALGAPDAWPVPNSDMLSCQNCGVRLLALVESSSGWRTMRSFGARIVSTRDNPSVAYVHCGACNALTPVPRALLPGTPVPAALVEMLEKEVGHERAQVVMNDDPPAEPTATPAPTPTPTPKPHG